MDLKKIKISIVGLGYVGLPVAVAFKKKNFEVIGYDINKTRIRKLKKYEDETGEVSSEELKETNIFFTSDFTKLSKANFHIITVPTPIDDYNNPDLTIIKNACETIGKIIKKNDFVIIESTVYPGVTEEIAVPIIEKHSKLKLNKDFSIGYSPERINPADKEHKFENITKVISASNKSALTQIDKVYKSVVKAGIYKASTIKLLKLQK